MKLIDLKNSFKSYINPSQIGYLIFYVTNRCNFRCNFCFYYAEIEKGRKPNELTLSEIQLLTKKIGPLLQLSLTGGEPFLRKDLHLVTELFIKNCHARYITIPTNGSLGQRMMDYLEYILPRYPNSFIRLTFSIDGIGDYHDNNRSMPGSYQKIVENYKLISPLRMKYKNLILDANSVFTSQSEDLICETLSALDNDFKFDNLSITYARGQIPNEKLKTKSKEKYIAANELLEKILRKKESRFLYPIWRGVRDVSRENLISTVFEDKFVTPCVAGRKLIVISETGDVKPCEILDESFGNLRDVDFHIYDLLNNAHGKKLQNWIVDSKCKCSFECALGANVVWNANQYPRLVISSIRNIGES
jgi:MoaA/NifB/PqqE/SkfB family radical SAM enzyme